MTYRIFNQNGQERDSAWLKQMYGNVEVVAADASDGADVFRLVELHERVGPSAVVVKVLDAEGQPMEAVPVLRHWPDAPNLPQWDPPPERWRDRAVVGYTNANGDQGFGMGQGDYYDPATQTGASAIWLAKPAIHSDLVTGLGMLTGTNHAHLDLTFQRVSGGEPGPGPGPTPPSGDAYETIAQGLERVAAGVRALGT